jgi:glycosyltransferase involved in cell wall biosynthesis
MPNRRLLVVAFHYPPDNTSTGVLRTLKFSRYLLDHGWCSEVLSVPERLYADTDPGMLDQIPPSVRVHRTWAVDIKRVCSIAGRYPSWLAVPDRFWSWRLSAVAKGVELHRERPFEALFTTYPMGSAHLVGLGLKRRLRLPWIADFRDPWVDDSIPPLRKRIESAMERRVVTRADRVICNTPAMRRDFLRRYPEIAPARFVTITNGYDEADFARLRPEPLPRFEILYAGNISAGSRNPAPLLEAVRLAADRGWLDPADLRVTFLGAGPYGRDPSFERDVRRTGLREQVDVVVERIPYSKALDRMAGADLLVALAEPSGHLPEFEAERHWAETQVPAKTYEILRLGRPLLALVSRGALAELIESTGCGEAVSPREPEAIAAALRRYYASGRKAPAETLPAVVRSYSREHLTSLLAAELDAVAAAR